MFCCCCFFVVVVFFLFFFDWWTKHDKDQYIKKMTSKINK